MPLETNVFDPKNRNTLKVGPDGEIFTVVQPHPPVVRETHFTVPLRQFLMNNGSTNMAVNGATTNQTFSITAIPDNDLFIKSISVEISAAGARLQDFGAITNGITNGVQVLYKTQDLGELELHDGIKTNLDMVRFGGGDPAFGSGQDAFKADLSGVGADTYLPFIDFSKVFGLQWGLKLRKNTEDTFEFVIRDNLTQTGGPSIFNVIVYGIKVVTI